MSYAKNRPSLPESATASPGPSRQLRSVRSHGEVRDRSIRLGERLGQDSMAAFLSSWVDKRQRYYKSTLLLGWAGLAWPGV